MSGRAKRLIATIVLLLFGSAIIIRGLSRLHHSPPEQPDATLIALTGNTMGGTWSVKLTSLPPGTSREQLESSVASLLDRLDNQMSIYKPASTISHFNNYHGTQWFDVPPELADVVNQSEIVSKESGGAFDVTVAPLVNLWGFGPEKSGGQINQIPTDAQIAAARRHVDYKNLQCRLSPPALRKLDPDLSVDLGGIGKGFAAGAVSDYLDSLNLKNYLVTIGGEVHARGSPQPGWSWRVGIETPTPDIRRIFTQIALHNASLSTSGDYRNFYDLAGLRFCHEINPATGRPIQNGLASVSIVHPNGARADALATALMVLGPGKGYDLARRLNLPILFIARGDHQFVTRKTPEFDRLVVAPGL